MLFAVAMGIPATHRLVQQGIPRIAAVRNHRNAVISGIHRRLEERLVGRNVESRLPEDIDRHPQIFTGVFGAFLDRLGEVVKPVQNIGDLDVIASCLGRLCLCGRHWHEQHGRCHEHREKSRSIHPRILSLWVIDETISSNSGNNCGFHLLLGNGKRQWAIVNDRIRVQRTIAYCLLAQSLRLIK